jgi:hypothetical protein
MSYKLRNTDTKRKCDPYPIYPLGRIGNEYITCQLTTDILQMDSASSSCINLNINATSLHFSQYGCYLR